MGKNEEESVASNEVHLSTCRGKELQVGGRRFCGDGLEILEEIYRIGFQGWYGGNWGLCQMVIQGIIFIKND